MRSSRFCPRLFRTLSFESQNIDMHLGFLGASTWLLFSSDQRDATRLILILIISSMFLRSSLFIRKSFSITLHFVIVSIKDASQLPALPTKSPLPNSTVVLQKRDAKRSDQTDSRIHSEQCNCSPT